MAGRTPDVNRAHSTGPTLTPVVHSPDHLLICFPFWLIQDPPREDTIIQFVLAIKTSDIFINQHLGLESHFMEIFVDTQ